MKYYFNDFPFYDQSVDDQVYYFYVQSSCGLYVETSRISYMSILQMCRRSGFHHHVDVIQTVPGCFSLFLEFEF